MPKVIYEMGGVSADGYIAGPDGRFDWAAPDEELHRFHNEQTRALGGHLLGRRLYETMVYWETMDPAEQPPPVADYAQIWRAADKVVYSATLESAASARTRIEREFDADAVRRLKESDSRELSVGGAELAGHAMRAGLVDELHLFLNPIVVGGGKRALPDDVTVKLELLGERRFASGVVYVQYRMAPA